MKHRMKRLFLGNWMSFVATTFNMKNMRTFLNGHNGSGKTTVMDALTLILYAEMPDHLNYTGDKQRSDRGAIHWNTPNGSLRPGKTTSYIIMEAEDANGRTYHQGIRMVSTNEQANPSRTYFQGEGTLESIGARNGGYEEVRNGTIVMQQAYRSKDEAFTNFFARRGYPVDTFIRARFNNLTPVAHFRNMNRSILSNTGIGGKSLSEYAQANIFPPASTTDNIDQMAKSQKRLTELLQMMRETEKKSVFFGKAVEAGTDYLEVKKDWNSFERAAANINYEFYSSEIERLEQEETEALTSKEKKEEESDRLKEKVKALVTLIAETKAEKSPVQRCKDELDKKLLMLQAAETRRERHEEYVRAREALEDMLPCGTHLEKAEDVLAGMEKEKEDLYAAYLKDKSAVDDAHAKLALLTSILHGDFSSEGGGRLHETMQSAILLKKEIKAAIPEADPQLLCDCIEKVSDKEWQDAVERLLGKDRFGIVVNAEHYRKACSIQHRLHGNRQDVIVLNTARKPEPVKKNTVPSIIIFNDIRAQRYVASSYGRYVLCSTDEEYGDAPCAIRKNGQTKVPSRSVLHGSQNRITRILGKGALQKEIDMLREELESLEKTMKASRQAYTDISGRIRRLGDLLASYRNTASHRDESAEKDVAQLKDEVRALTEKINELKNSSEARERERKLKALEDELSRTEEAGKKADEETRNIANTIDGIRNTLKESRTQFSKFTAEKEKHGPLLEEDRRIAEKNKWTQSLLGYANVNNMRKQLKESLAAKKEILDTRISTGGDILQAIPGAPMGIETEEELMWYEAEDEKLRALRTNSSEREEIERIKESMKASFSGMLHGMCQDLARAKEVHKKFNSFLPKYKIGICRYRLGAIRVISGNNAHLMNLALKQDSGEQLTLEDIQYIDRIFTDVLSDDEKSVRWNPFDYRRYVTTRMEYQTDDMDTGWLNADRASEANSAGQQAILRGIIKIVVLASQAFTEDSLRLCITDEVLQGVDDNNSKYFFDALKNMNIQCIFASMEERFAVHADDAYVFRMTQGKYVKVLHHGIREEITQNAS